MPEIYDWTFRKTVKVDDLILVSKATYSGSAFLELGLVTRFTPARVYYMAARWNSQVDDGQYYTYESWTNRTNMERWDNSTGKYVRKKSNVEFFNGTILLHDADRNMLIDATRHRMELQDWN